MTRGDAILRHRRTGTHRYYECKTSSVDNKGWRDGWPYAIQVMAGVLGAERNHAIKIDEVEIQGFIKGQFKSSYDTDTKSYSGPKYQQSILCYGYRRPANPPIQDEEWAAKYEFKDPITGGNRKLGKSFQRALVSELPKELWHGKALSVSQYWVDWLLPTGVLDDAVVSVGPMYRQDAMLEGFIRQTVAEERKIQESLFSLSDLGLAWHDPRFQAALDEHFPRALGKACLSYFGDACEHKKTCWYEAGWDQPELQGMGARKPHHELELIQMRARGLAPDGLFDDEDED